MEDRLVTEKYDLEPAKKWCRYMMRKETQQFRNWMMMNENQNI